MIEIAFTGAETGSGKIDQQKLLAAHQALRDEGIVILKGVVDPHRLQALREKMLEDLKIILSRPNAPFNFNTGNVQQDPPPFAPYLYKDVLLNELVISVTQSVLGPGIKNNFYSGNTALPGGARQPVHPDVAQLWPGLEHPTPAFGLVVNIPVVDVTPENGSTEIWPGTHLDTTYSIQDGAARVSEEALARWRDKTDPVQPDIALGSVVIRDIRLWHAGMPNHTQIPRPMIAMIHWCGWWNDDSAIVFPEQDRAFFEHPVLETIADFTSEPIDYLHHNEAYDVKN